MAKPILLVYVLCRQSNVKLSVNIRVFSRRRLHTNTQQTIRIFVSILVPTVMYRVLHLHLFSVSLTLSNVHTCLLVGAV